MAKDVTPQRAEETMDTGTDSTAVDHRPDFLPKIGRHLAHELNNPISAISSAAFLIQDFIDTAEGGLLDTEMVKPFIESIREECNKLKGIVEEFAKYVTTESILTMPIDLNEFLKNRVAEFSMDGTNVNFRESGESISILADSGQLQFALKALIQSSLLAGAKTIDISVSGGSNCTITIKDDRENIPSQSELDDSFSPIPSKRPIGLGLKLPLVRKVIALHHGRIEAHAEFGKGATICLHLPLTQDK